jgi:predicted  nucleic acid-binding Zn-ribbon protein
MVASQKVDMPIELEILKNERDKLRESLREVEAEVRKAEADLKTLRQREIQTKREIEALTTLVDIKEHREAKPEAKPPDGG